MPEVNRLKVKMLTAAAWIAGLFCLLGFFLICSIWFLVPNDRALNQGAQMVSKPKPIAVVALIIAIFAFSSKALFALRDRKDQLD